MFESSYHGCTTQATQASNGEMSVRVQERTHGNGRLKSRKDPSRVAGALPVCPEGGSRFQLRNSQRKTVYGE